MLMHRNEMGTGLDYDWKNNNIYVVGVMPTLETTVSNHNLLFYWSLRFLITLSFLLRGNSKKDLLTQLKTQNKTIIRREAERPPMEGFTDSNYENCYFIS